MQCPNCHASLKPNARFCASCGHALDQPRCPQCNAPIDPSHRFCAKCGYDLQNKTSTTVAPARTKETKRKSRRSRWLALATVVVLAFVSALAYWLWPPVPATPIPPSPRQTPTLTVTVLMGPADEIWEQAQEAASNGNISEAVTLLHQLRADHPDYKPEQITSRQEELCTNWYAYSPPTSWLHSTA